MNKKMSKGLSVIHVLGIIFALGIVALLLFAESDSDRAEKESAQRFGELTQLTNAYYGKGEVNAGTFGAWKVHAITPEGGKINTISVRVAVDRKTADGILDRSIDGRARAAANGCPPRSNQLYALMTNNDNLKLQVAVDGDVFIDVDCKRWR